MTPKENSLKDRERPATSSSMLVCANVAAKELFRHRASQPSGSALDSDVLQTTASPSASLLLYHLAAALKQEATHEH